QGITWQRSQHLPNGEVRLLPFRSVTDFSAKGVRCADFDNDARPDIVAWNEAAIQFYRGTLDGTFTRTDWLSAIPLGITQCDVGDLDGDGDIDLAVAGTDGLRWYVNDGGNANHWIDISLKAETE